MWISLLLACSRPTAPAQPSAPEPVRTEAPEPTTKAAGPILVEALGIRWQPDSHSIQVEARLAGEGLKARTDVVHVGVTVITESDQEIDLLVTSVFPAMIGESLFFTSELPEAPKQVLIGAWDRKVEPCAVDRQGCREFGFVLDGSLGSFPPGLYDEGLRQRLLPETLRVAVAGEPADELHVVADYAAIFGSTVKRVEPPAAKAAQAPGVYVARPDDLPLARAIAAKRQLSTHVEPIDADVWIVLP